MEFINENELIKEFIREHNTCEYDIKKILIERGNFRPFITGHNKKEKISMAYQMLQYAMQNFNGDYSLLYGRFYYVGGSKFPDNQFNKFNEHIVNPLIEYIKLYLENIHDDVLEQERGDGMMKEQNFTIQNANNSTIVMNSKVGGNVITDVKINDDVKIEVEKILKSIEEEVRLKNLDAKEEIFELISEINENIKFNQKPKKSILTAFKTLCEGAIPLATKLLEIFYK